jgi:hypothetical protein
MLRIKESIEFRFQKSWMLVRLAAASAILVTAALLFAGSLVLFRPMAAPISFILGVYGYRLLKRCLIIQQHEGLVCRLDGSGVLTVSPQTNSFISIPWSEFLGSAFIPSTGRARRLMLFWDVPSGSNGDATFLDLQLDHFTPALLLGLKERLELLAPNKGAFKSGLEVIYGRWTSVVTVPLTVILAVILGFSAYSLNGPPSLMRGSYPVLFCAMILGVRHKWLSRVAYCRPILIYSGHQLYLPGHSLQSIAFRDIANSLNRLGLIYLIFKKKQYQLSFTQGDRAGRLCFLSFYALNGGRNRLIDELKRHSLWKNKKHAVRAGI